MFSCIVLLTYELLPIQIQIVREEVDEIVFLLVVVLVGERVRFGFFFLLLAIFLSNQEVKIVDRCSCCGYSSFSISSICWVYFYVFVCCYC